MADNGTSYENKQWMQKHHKDLYDVIKGYCMTRGLDFSVKTEDLAFTNRPAKRL